MKQLLLLFLFLPLVAMSQYKLSVEVQGVSSDKGKISVAVYNEANGFLKFDKVFKTDSTVAKEKITKVVIDDLPNGEYAVAVFHDENSNDTLDTNWLGIPKEAIGFSMAKMKTFGPPGFKDCAFEVHGDMNIKVWFN
ncbi:DUF2141 domain-containing protein [Arenibacter sp. 6A1]|uniref:DUF2141 domain-containing protein n=1 Tax=Arenibacter sp. 6A1 TaxID=2720391 RepID=UPI0014485902|nr:DUF2141 domain-containing protein [Arenibacter sp. 6A1]NKI26661.1 DUF2141 domain-containing protein [Arenibacter sp. 6A1]